MTVNRLDRDVRIFLDRALAAQGLVGQDSVVRDKGREPSVLRPSK